MNLSNVKKEILSQVIKIAPKDAHFISNIFMNDDIEMGYKWQVNQYIEEDSYRELTLTVENRNPDNNFFDIILVDDLIDYDQTASSEEQYVFSIELNEASDYNKLMDTFKETVENITSNKDSYHDFSEFDSRLKKLGYTLR